MTLFYQKYIIEKMTWAAGIFSNLLSGSGNLLKTAGLVITAGLYLNGRIKIGVT